MSKRNLRLTLRQTIWRFRGEKWFWIILTPVAFKLGWVNHLSFTAFLSLYALILTLASGEQGAKAAYEASDESSE